jgi:hypothetical protein
LPLRQKNIDLKKTVRQQLRSNDITSMELTDRSIMFRVFFGIIRRMSSPPGFFRT